MNIRKFLQLPLALALSLLSGTGSADAAKTIADAAEAPIVRMAQLQIKPDCLAAFREAVKEEMQDALRLEPGVLAIYAVADKNDPTRLTFFEIYASEDTYQLHRQTPHFKKYLDITKNMVLDKTLIEAVPVELRDKHNTPGAK